MTAFETKEVSDTVRRYGAALLIKPLDLHELEELSDGCCSAHAPIEPPALGD